MSDELAAFAATKPSHEELRKRAIEMGMRSMWDDGMAKVAQGLDFDRGARTCRRNLTPVAWSARPILMRLKELPLAGGTVYVSRGPGPVTLARERR